MYLLPLRMAQAEPVLYVACLGEDRPVSPVSDHSTTGRLNLAQEVPEQPLQHTTTVLVLVRT